MKALEEFLFKEWIKKQLIGKLYNMLLKKQMRTLYDNWNEDLHFKEADTTGLL